MREVVDREVETRQVFGVGLFATNHRQMIEQQTEVPVNLPVPSAECTGLFFNAYETAEHLLVEVIFEAHVSCRHADVLCKLCQPGVESTWGAAQQLGVHDQEDFLLRGPCLRRDVHARLNGLHKQLYESAPGVWRRRECPECQSHLGQQHAVTPRRVRRKDRRRCKHSVQLMHGGLLHVARLHHAVEQLSEHHMFAPRANARGLNARDLRPRAVRGARLVFHVCVAQHVFTPNETARASRDVVLFCFFVADGDP